MMMRYVTSVAFSCAVALLCATSAFAQDNAQGNAQGNAQANKGEVDPGAVSEGLRAIFRYGSANHDLADRLNANTVTMMSGAFGGTYVRFGADLASVLDKGDELRVLPISGAGRSKASPTSSSSRASTSASSAPTRSITWSGRATPATSGAVHLHRQALQRRDACRRGEDDRSLADLNGKRSRSPAEGGTFVTAITIFERLGIRPDYLYVEQRVA